MYRLITLLVVLVCSPAIAIAYGAEGVKPPVMLDPETVMNEAFVSSVEFEGVWRKEGNNNGTYELKVIKDDHWAVKGFEDEIFVSMYFGGSFLLSGGIYIEKVEFVETSYGPRIGSTHSYELSVKGNVLYQKGIGETTRSEEWTRVENNSLSQSSISTSSTIESSSSEIDMSLLYSSLYIIETESGMGKVFGSGFVVEMDGKKYLITNQHVLTELNNISIKSVGGQQLSPKLIETYEGLDLARMCITNDVPALPVNFDIPEIGDVVSVFGNSDGGGVITKIDGKVLGVGPDLIEVDAEFIHGNSGCPIVDSEGRVVGVATFATYYENPNDILAKGTRFQKIRRYGLRLRKEGWKATSIDNYQRQAKMLSDAEQAIMMYSVSYMVYLYRPFSRWNGNVRDTTYEEYVALLAECEPKKDAYYSKSLYARCKRHYYKSNSRYLEHFTSFDIDRAHLGHMAPMGEAMASIKQLKLALGREKFVSEYFQAKADELIGVCGQVQDTYLEVRKKR